MAPPRERRIFHAIDTFNQPYRPITFGGPTNYNTDRIGAIWGSWYYNAPKSGRIGITFLSIFILLCLLFLGLTLLAIIYGLIKQSRIFDSCCGFRPDHHEQRELIHKYEKNLREKEARKWFKGKQHVVEEPSKEEMDVSAAREEASRRRVRFANKESDTDESTEADERKELDREVTAGDIDEGNAARERHRSVAGSSDGVFVSQVNRDEDEGEDIYSADGRRTETRQVDLRRAQFTSEQQQRLRDADARRSVNRAASREAGGMRDIEWEILATDIAGQQAVHQMPPLENLTRLQKARLRYEKWSQKKY